MISIKTNEQIKLMEYGGNILAHVINEAKKISVSGTSTLEIDSFIEKLILKYKAKPAFKNFHGYPFSSCLSINEELVHALPSKKILQDGDILSIDAGVLFKGFNTDSAITFGIGNISDPAKKLIEITKKSLDDGLKLVKDGQKIGDIQSKIQEIIESNGFSVVRDLSGHGIGKKLQEEPSIPNFGKKGSGFMLKEGMTLCIEPMAILGSHKVMLMIDKWTVSSYDKNLTAHFEHTFVVTKNGCRILTDFK